ncbi:MAG: endolytic transglycosylase MltG [Lachnospiraceae bacterium]|jgi:UPF0755 protein
MSDSRNRYTNEYSGGGYGRNRSGDGRNQVRRKKRDRFSRKQSIVDMVGNIAKYVVIILLILFFIGETRRMYGLGYSIFCPEAMDASGEGKTVSVTITDDMTDSSIAKLLEDDKLIESSLVFKVQLKFSEYDGKLMPGTYTLSSEMLPNEMMKLMSESYTDEDSAAAASSGTASAGAASSDAASSDTADTGSTSGVESTGATAGNVEQ